MTETVGAWGSARLFAPGIGPAITGSASWSCATARGGSRPSCLTVSTVRKALVSARRDGMPAR